MKKRRPSFDATQLGFAFDAPPPASADGALAGLDRRVSSAVSTILSQAGRSRYDVAGGMSRLLDEDVSKMMLDAYASEAREGHNISVGRFLTLVSETGRYDVLNALLREIGAAVVVGEEILTVELGHVRRQMKILADREAQLRRVAPVIKGGGQ